MAPDWRIVDRKPSAGEYEMLCRSVGWERYVDFANSQAALDGSLHAVTAETASGAVGMGRIVGDGAMFFYINDVAVHPSMHGRGVGEAILQALISWLRQNAPGQLRAFLFSAAGKEDFYARFGFAQVTSGMRVEIDTLRRS